MPPSERRMDVVGLKRSDPIESYSVRECGQSCDHGSIPTLLRRCATRASSKMLACIVMGPDILVVPSYIDTSLPNDTSHYRGSFSWCLIRKSGFLNRITWRGTSLAQASGILR